MATNRLRPTECPTCLRAFRDDNALDLNELLIRFRENNRQLRMTIATLNHEADMQRLEAEARVSAASQRVHRQTKEIRRLQERLAEMAGRSVEETT